MRPLQPHRQPHPVVLPLPRSAPAAISCLLPALLSRAVGLRGCGLAVGLQGCRAVGLCGCGAMGLPVGLWGCRAVGLWGWLWGWLQFPCLLPHPRPSPPAQAQGAVGQLLAAKPRWSRVPPAEQFPYHQSSVPTTRAETPSLEQGPHHQSIVPTRKALFPPGKLWTYQEISVPPAEQCPHQESAILTVSHRESSIPTRRWVSSPGEPHEDVGVSSSRAQGGCWPCSTLRGCVGHAVQGHWARGSMGMELTPSPGATHALLLPE